MNILHTFSSVFIVDFKQINISWVGIKRNYRNSPVSYVKKGDILELFISIPIFRVGKSRRFQVSKKSGLQAENVIFMF